MIVQKCQIQLTVNQNLKVHSYFSKNNNAFGNFEYFDV